MTSAPIAASGTRARRVRQGPHNIPASRDDTSPAEYARIRFEAECESGRAIRGCAATRSMISGTTSSGSIELSRKRSRPRNFEDPAKQIRET